MLDPSERLALARRHLAKVQVAWTSPTDWADLTVYGLYALEAAVLAAASHLGLPIRKTHWHKRDLARELTAKHGLPDIVDLLGSLNDARKAIAYGDEAVPELCAEDVASEIEEFVDATTRLIEGGAA